MTATTSIRIEQPGEPVVVYSHLGALGHRVPAFGLVFTPQLPVRPSTFHLHAHKPGEPGSAFHARVLADAHMHARIDGADPSLLAVWFTDVLPPVAWREQWQARMRARWTMVLPYAHTSERIWAAGRMLELLGMVREGAMDKERQP